MTEQRMVEVGSNGMKRLQHVARILGAGTAAAKSLAEYERRKADGEDVAIFEGRHSLIVGPRPRTAALGEG